MSPDPSPDPDRVPATFQEARELLISTSWTLLTKQQKARIRTLFERRYNRSLYPREILFFAVNEPEERK